MGLFRGVLIRQQLPLKCVTALNPFTIFAKSSTLYDRQDLNLSLDISDTKLIIVAITMSQKLSNVLVYKL